MPPLFKPAILNANSTIHSEERLSKILAVYPEEINQRYGSH